MEPTTPTATATATARRKANVKSTKSLRELVTQIDALFPSLSGKPAADLLCEKSSILKTLIQIEGDAEERLSEQHDADQAAKIAELEQQVSVSMAKIRELERESARLKVAADNPRTITVSDPEAAKVKEQNASLEHLLTHIVESLTPESRAGFAVRLTASSVADWAVELFCKAAKLDYRNLEHYRDYSQDALQKLATAKDSNGPLIRAWLSFRFPAPVKSEAPAFIPDTRSADEKLRDAKASVRSGLIHPVSCQLGRTI